MTKKLAPAVTANRKSMTGSRIPTSSGRLESRVAESPCPSNCSNLMNRSNPRVLWIHPSKCRQSPFASSEQSRGPDRMKANNVLEILKAKLFAPQPRVGTPDDRGKILQFDSRNPEQKMQPGWPGRV